METSLRDAIQEYTLSVASIGEALQANPEDHELVELKAQLEAAIEDAQAALDGLQAPSDAENGAASQPAATHSHGSSAMESAATARPRAAQPGRNNARIHPRSKYAHLAPDFQALAAKHPSLRPFLVPPGGGKSGAGRTSVDQQAEGEAGAAAAAAVEGRAAINFADPAACRELTRVLLLEDFGIQWWVPAGQLVPPVTNRANYIHWLQDLLSLSAPPGPVVGLDIGCGANLAYPLLGAALCGWRFVGADVTPVALAWAAQNLGANPQLAPLIELRSVAMQPEQRQFLAAVRAGGTKKASTAGAAAAGADLPGAGEPSQQGSLAAGDGDSGPSGSSSGQNGALPAVHLAQTPPRAELTQASDPGAATDAAELAHAPPAVAAAQAAPIVTLGPDELAGGGLVSGALRKGERLAFCMCNPPFFDSLEAAGRNPATAYGGTAEEMVYPGGELAFVTAMVQDSLTLRGAVHWYTTMVGKKATLRAARSLLYRHGVRVLRTTEFFQGKTSRWALAWSFTADAAAATKPLPRFPAGGAATLQDRDGEAGAIPAGAAGGGPAGQLAPSHIRKLSWQIAAPPAGAARLLDIAQRSLQQAGLQCRVERATYSIQGSYLPAQEAAAARPDATVPVSSAASALGAVTGPVAKRQRLDAASAAADAHHCGGGPVAPSQQNTHDAPQPEQMVQGAQSHPGPSSPQPWQLELKLFMQHAGHFLLTAALHRAAPEAAAPWFGQLARRLQQALAAQYKVQA